jgi:hypothetical protein
MDGVFYSLDAIWSLIALRWATMDRAARVPARVQPKETLKFLQILTTGRGKEQYPEIRFRRCELTRRSENNRYRVAKQKNCVNLRAEDQAYRTNSDMPLGMNLIAI